MMDRRVWTLDEIKRLPSFGNEHGWFYGLVQDEGLHLSEIVPGYGYTSARWGWRVPNPITVLRDIRRFRPDRLTPRDEMVAMAEAALPLANEALALAEAESDQEKEPHHGDDV